MRSSKESSRLFSVEAVALPNLPQTFRGRERSKRGYAVDPLLLIYCTVHVDVHHVYNSQYCIYIRNFLACTEHCRMGTEYVSPDQASTISSIDHTAYLTLQTTPTSAKQGSTHTRSRHCASCYCPLCMLVFSTHAPCHEGFLHPCLFFPNDDSTLRAQPLPRGPSCPQFFRTSLFTYMYIIIPIS